MANTISTFQLSPLPELSKKEDTLQPLDLLTNFSDNSDLEPLDFSHFSNAANHSNKLIEPVSLFHKDEIKINKTEKNEESPAFSEVKKGAVIETGQNGTSVKELQTRLTKLGFGIKSSGEFGKTTEEMVKKFQARYGLAQTGKFGPTSLSALETAENASKLGNKLAASAKQVARSRNTIGHCYNAVWVSIFKQFGDFLRGDSAYMAANQLAVSGKFKELKVGNSELDKLPAGSVVVWGKTPKSPNGHISIALGDGREASDHIAGQLTNLRGYSNYRVFLPVKS
jgi:hypothetical protein